MSYKFFQNLKCEYFPYRTGIDKADFNCLFCYFPFYFLDDCGGKCKYLKGLKVCTDFNYIRNRDNYQNIIDKLRKVLRK